MPRKYLGQDVFNQAIDRMVDIYKEGHRVVVSFSGGKDSCCVLNVCMIAAQLTNRLPVEVVMQDEEIAYPGTYEYCERVAADPDVSFNWLVMNQPMINAFNRKEPYWWAFDPKLDPSDWVRTPPSYAQVVPEKDISMMTIPSRFPPPPGKHLYAVMGMRISESRGRLYGIYSSGGYITKPNKWGVRGARPIFDWTDGDVWKAIRDNKWDYNAAYNALYAMGIPAPKLRVAPPTMNAHGIEALAKAAAAWPQWFGKVAKRCPGVRTAAQFGKRSVQASRRLGETWEDCYKRECIDNAPKWISDRAKDLKKIILSAHARHSTQSLPEVKPCYTCHGTVGSWKRMTEAMYLGDPFSTKVAGMLPFVEPTLFRADAPGWFDVTPPIVVPQTEDLEVPLNVLVAEDEAFEEGAA